MSRSLTKQVLEKYPAKYFVETGTYTGGGVSAVLIVGMHEKVVSIEVDEILYNTSKKLFENNDNVLILLGDSALKLKDVLELVDERALIFLDAHTIEYNPILEELETIKRSGIDKHIVMIDDKREFVRGVWPDITVKVLLDKLLEINPNYEIRYEDSVNAKGDIITAWIP